MSVPTGGDPLATAVNRRTEALERPDMAGAGGKSARGIAWNVGLQVVSAVLRLGSLAVLARLLTPDDYGLVAIVTSITGLVAVVGTLGVSEAVIQQARITQAQASTLFWINAAFGLVLMLLAMACAPLLALAFGREELTGITIASATTFLIAGLGVQHQALMMRRLMHRQVALRQLASVVVGIVVAVVAAFAGAGYWALVLQAIVQGVVQVLLSWVALPWRPGLARRRSGVREMLSFGGGVSTFQILNYLGRNADNIIIGFFIGAAPLGVYTRAYGLLTAPLQQIHAPVARVMRPTMGALWVEPERYRKYYLTVLAGLCYVCMPLVLVLAVLADDVVDVMLGDGWAESATVFRWLAVVGLVQTVGYTNGWLYATSGRAWEWARWGLISRPVIIASFFVGIPWGIQGVAAAYAAAEVVLTPIGIWRASRGTPVALRDVLLSVARPAALAVLMAVTALVVSELVDGGSLLTLAAAVPAAGLVGVAAGLLWPTVRRDVLSMLGSLRTRKG